MNEPLGVRRQLLQENVLAELARADPRIASPMDTIPGWHQLHTSI